MTRRGLIGSVTAVTLICLVVVMCVAQDRDNRRGGKNPDRKKGRPVDKIKEGDRAPDFELKSLDGKRKVKLSSFQGKKPVALIFGSYT